MSEQAKKHSFHHSADPSKVSNDPTRYRRVSHAGMDAGRRGMTMQFLAVFIVSSRIRTTPAPVANQSL